MTLNCGVWKFVAAMAQLSEENALFDVNREQKLKWCYGYRRKANQRGKTSFGLMENL